MRAHDAVDETEEVARRGEALGDGHLRTAPSGLPPALADAVAEPVQERGGGERYEQRVVGADLQQQIAAACPRGDPFTGEPGEVGRAGQGGTGRPHQARTHTDGHGQIARGQAQQPRAGPGGEGADGLAEVGQQGAGRHPRTEVGHHGQQIALRRPGKHDACLMPTRRRNRNRRGCGRRDSGGPVRPGGGVR